MQKPARIFKEVITHLFRKPATCAYPFEPAHIYPHFRGRIEFDSSKCIGCQICVKVCPSKAIEIPLSAEQPAAEEGKPARRKFDCIMKLDHCVYCAQCVDSCPKKALGITQDFELAHVDRKELRRHYK